MGGGRGLEQVNFFFTKNPNLKKNIFLFFFVFFVVVFIWGGGRGWGRGLE